jgi:hypothetical protein
MLEKIQALRKSRPPVPRPTFTKQDPLSRSLRRFDNTTLSIPSPNEMVYIGTNEDGVNDTFEQLNQLPANSEACHFGFSGWHNFDIAAQRKSSRVIICDINPENALFIQASLDNLRKSLSPAEFIENMKEYTRIHRYQYNNNKVLNEDFSRSINFSTNVSNDPLYADINYLADNPVGEQLQVELKRPLSWVFDLDKFNHIRDLAMKDKIVLLTEDICATTTFTKIKSLLVDNGVQIDTIYLSNICDYMQDEAREQFINTVRQLSSGAHVINASGNKQTVFTPKASEDITELQTHLFPPKPAIATDSKSTPSSTVKSSCSFFSKASAGAVCALALASIAYMVS